MIKGLQVIGIAAGFLLLIYTYNNYNKNIFSLKQSIFFTLIWFVLISLFFYPPLLLYLLPYLSTQDYVMSIIVLSILFLLLSVFYIYNELLRIEKMISKVVQNLALSEKMIEDDYQNE